MGTRRFAQQTVLVVAAALSSPPGAAGPFADLDGGFVYDDNLGRAERSRDRVGELGVEAQLRAGRRFVLRDDATITLAGTLRAQDYRDFADLAELAPGLAMSYRRKLGLGAEVPWFALALGAERIESGSRIRDGWQYEASLHGGRRMGERLNLTGTLRFRVRDADEDAQVDERPPAVPAPPPSGVTRGDVFDHRVRELEFGVDYLCSESLLLLASARLIDGDIASTAVPYDRILAEAKAFTQDYAFGGDTFTYRLEARTYAFSIALNRALDERTSLDFGWEYQRSEADGGIDYSRSLARLRLLYSW
jgi:hypothetical protein